MEWYYEYEVHTIDGGEEEIYRGVISAGSFAEATHSLEEFYGESLTQISYLGFGMETVYEFDNPETHWKREVPDD